MNKVLLSDIKILSTANRQKLPDWIRVRAPISEEFNQVKNLARQLNLNTVCESAACPNISECWKKRHATFMIMGNICTRKCRFCNIKNGKPNELDKTEPYNVAKAVKTLELRHVVITSVDRDDLQDGGAEHFAQTIYEIRNLNPNTTIEVLTPDFLNKGDAINIVIKAKPDVYNHNIETVKRIFSKIKIGSNYNHSLSTLKKVKESDNSIFTKSGIIAGMGESNEEIIETMKDLRHNKVDFLTIGQYLRPNSLDRRYIDVDRFLTPSEFDYLKQQAYNQGFLMVSSSPLTRSSYHADEDFDKLKKKLNIEN
jgi:lipoic acid synthetase